MLYGRILTQGFLTSQRGSLRQWAQRCISKKSLDGLKRAMKRKRSDYSGRSLGEMVYRVSVVALLRCATTRLAFSANCFACGSSSSAFTT
jgi:hypothetical protein